MVRASLVMVVICTLGRAWANAEDEQPYLDACRRFADTVLEHGQDRYGPKHTPLFVDGLNTETLEPVIWLWKGERWVLSNFASQQSWLRLLDGLTALTGEARYRQAAMAAAKYALKHLRTPNGLMNWGGHRAWDLAGEKAVFGQPQHELRNQSPYFEMLWRADADETKRLMETIWGAHIYDWGTLDFNRHASSTDASRRPQWSHPFDESLSVPFLTEGQNLSFANAAGPLIYTGAMLAKLDSNETVATWTRRFAYRWKQAAHVKTGLCGGQISYRAEDRARQALGHVHPGINEANMVATYHRNSRYHVMALIQLQAGESLGGRIGQELVQWASDDLKAFARHAYDAESNAFRSLITDGTRLKGEQSKSHYYRKDALGPQQASAKTVWAYATAYRLTKDPAHWDLLRKVCAKLTFGDIGSPNGEGRRLRLTCGWTDFMLIYAFLELQRATGDEKFVKMASRIGDNILARRTRTTCLPKEFVYVRTGDESVLALLHLAAARAGKSTLIPRPARDQQYFHCAYDGAPKRQVGPDQWDQRTWDSLAIYNKRKAAGEPRK